MTVAAPTTLEIALSYLKAGLGVLPIRPDGTKAPALPKGHPYLRERPAEADLRRWFASGRNGIAVPGGKVSGNLETLDFETVEIWRAWCELVDAQLPGLSGRLSWVKTPGHYGQRGMHGRYRCPAAVIPGSMELARDRLLDETGMPVTDDKGNARARLLIETRGEGGYAVAPGSPPACHETGRLWEHVAGPGLTELPGLAPLEREVLLSSARALNSWVDEVDRATSLPRPGGGLLPGDDYNRRGPDWPEILGAGWVCVRAAGEVRYWRRPGKDRGTWSATTGYCKVEGVDLLHVFSGNADPFAQGRSYSKFRAYALLGHKGDFKAAAAALAREGYGERRHEANGHAKNGKAPAEVKAAEPEPWDQPVPLGDDGSKVEPFPVNIWPPQVAGFWEDAAQASNCPVDYLGAFGIGAISGAVGATLAVDIKPGWSERLAAYICNVAPKGSGKTPAYKAVFAPYFEEAARRHAARDDRPLYVSNVTVEKLADILRQDARGVPLIRDELAGWMRSMDEYKNKGSGSDRQFWLEVDSGTPICVHRKDPDSPPVWVPFPCVPVVGGIQPKVLGRLTGDDDGFFDRINFSFADALPARGENWDEVHPVMAANWARLIRSLFEQEMEGHAGALRPFFLKLSPAARKAWEDWTNWIAARRNDPAFPEYLKGPAIKLTGVAVRLAGIVFAARQRKSAQLEGEEMEAGALLARYFLSHAGKVYRAMGRDPRIGEAQKVLAWLRRWGKPSFNRRDAWRALRCSFAQPEELTPPLKLLQAHGFIRWLEQGPTGGRPSTPTYEVNPHLPDVTRDRSDESARSDSA